MSAAVDFHSQIASIVEVLANAAVTEICKVVDDEYAVVHLEMSRSQKENEILRRRLKLVELQLSRYRVERLRRTEGSNSSRHTWDRLHNQQGQSLQSRTRFLNHEPRRQQCVRSHINLDQDPDQEVVTTTKAETAEPEKVGELVIVKVEGAMETAGTNSEVSRDGDISTGEDANPTTSLLATSKDSSRHSSIVEVSGSGFIPIVVDSAAETNSSPYTTKSPQLTGSDVRAGDHHRRNLDSDVTAHMDTVLVPCDDVRDSRSTNVLYCNTALDPPKSFLSEVTIIEGGGRSDNAGEQCEWLHVDQTNKAADRSRHQQTTLPMIQCTGLESAKTMSVHPGSVLPCDDPQGISTNSFSDVPKVAPHCPAPSQNGRHHRLSSSWCHQAPYHATNMDRPFGCTSCTKRFLLESDLQKHIASHNRGKRYTCLVCGKSFVCQSQLDIHGNVHTGERPFSCSMCNRCFSHPSNLKRHEKIQH